MRRLAFMIVGLVGFLSVGTCSDGGGAKGDASDGPAVGCCPPDPEPDGCTNLGGYSESGCVLTCDFLCSTNWRLENDSHGCPVWRWDVRAPLPGEGPGCVPGLDAAADGAP